MFGEDFTLNNFCDQTAGILQYVGWVILVIKIAIPIIIFAMGIIDLGKAVVAAKEDDTKAAVKRLIWRIVAGIAIFFLPSLIMWLFGTIKYFQDDAAGFETCKACINNPGGSVCSSAVSALESEG